MKSFRLMVTSFVVFVFLAAPTTVWAATEECTTTTGSYGQTSTTCKVLGVTTDTHETVNAGLGDVNFLFLAALLVTFSGVVFGVSKLTQKVYWFD